MTSTSRRSTPAFGIPLVQPAVRPVRAFLQFQQDWIRRYQEAVGQLPFAEVPPPVTEKLYLPLDATTEAVVEITIKTRGLGAIDPPTRRAPTAKELHTVAGLLTRRIYQFTPASD